MQLPEWLPPSFRGIAARYGHILRAVVHFTGTPAAMQQLTKHLSLENSKRASSGSLLRLETQGRSRPGKAGKAKGVTEQRLEKTAVAKVPILVLPIQVYSSLASRLEALYSVQALITWPASSMVARLREPDWERSLCDLPLRVKPSRGT